MNTTMINEGSWQIMKKSITNTTYRNSTKMIKIGIEQILDMYAIQNLLQRICKLF